jgi:hypothetical protein
VQLPGENVEPASSRELSTLMLGGDALEALLDLRRARSIGWLSGRTLCTRAIRQALIADPSATDVQLARP